ncbi:MAG: hypothetical protein KBA60_02080 [Flavobacteriales bacterium]|nr:hypothetical protein [Flavobacteriales bacterium]MBP6642181.1 hypothetical protein [Flavobacteriales bacterium]MBP7154770.1 hypothetical protein [Flavobacteriales bacterium]HQV73930.1 hypothetical protein [Flavobacteriales bacterium]HQW39599.1 hypothetical protein [Flavobacteriales bacterium]
MRTSPMPVEQDDDKGQLYWLVYNVRKGITRRVGSWIKRKPVVALIVFLVALYSLFVMRAMYQPVVLGFRKYFFWILILLFLIWLVRKLFRRSTAWKKVMGSLVSLLLIMAVAWILPRLVHYGSQYVYYNELNKVQVDQLPITGHERIQPISSIHTLTDQEALSETEDATMPRFVRNSEGGYGYTTAIGPSKAYKVQQFSKDMYEVISIPGDLPSPNFSSDYRDKVEFEVGEFLLFSKNTHTAVVKRFDPWKYCTMEPSDPVYLQNDDGEWVQVVPLTKWVGFVFPRPVFGGVMVIDQHKSTDTYAERLFLGKGSFISAEAIADHPFLQGQDVMPREVTRYIAESFRFRRGFMAPMPGYHEGDIRVPQLAEGQDPQPFVVYSELKGAVGKLHNYFGLEPFEEAKKGLSVSLFIPGDGMAQVYFIDHTMSGTAYMGSSAVGAKIIESRKEYDWSHSYPAETRPYIRTIGGVDRLFWLSTIVTRAGDGQGRSIGGSMPEITITDAVTGKVTWIPQDLLSAPDRWIEKVQAGTVDHRPREE